MAFREDWTRIAQSIHNIFQAFRSPTRGAMERSRNNLGNSPRAQPRAILVGSTMNARFLAEIERRRAQAYMSNARNQVR